MGSRNRRGGCTVSNQLAFRVKFRQSPVQTFTQSYRTYPKNSIGSYRNSSMLASKNVVTETKTDGSASAPETSKTQADVHCLFEFSPRTFEESQMDSVCLESEWKKCLTGLRWPESCIVVYREFIAQSTRNLYNRYLVSFREFCLDKYRDFPPPQQLLSAAVAEFLSLKSKQSDRPESMLRGIMAALSNYLNIPGKTNPVSQETRNLVKALIKTGTVRQAGRTSIMPIAPFGILFQSCTFPLPVPVQSGHLSITARIFRSHRWPLWTGLTAFPFLENYFTFSLLFVLQK